MGAGGRVGIVHEADAVGVVGQPVVGLDLVGSLGEVPVQLGLDEFFVLGDEAGAELGDDVQEGQVGGRATARLAAAGGVAHVSGGLLVDGDDGLAGLGARVRAERQAEAVGQLFEGGVLRRVAIESGLVNRVVWHCLVLV